MCDIDYFNCFLKQRFLFMFLGCIEKPMNVVVMDTLSSTVTSD